MSMFQSKITYHTKSKENSNLNKKRQATYANTDRNVSYYKNALMNNYKHT